MADEEAAAVPEVCDQPDQLDDAPEVCVDQPATIHCLAGLLGAAGREKK